MLEVSCWSFSIDLGESVFPPLASQGNFLGTGQGRVPSKQQNNCQKINSLLSRFTHIQYTVRAEYAAKNQEYIRRILDDLRASCRTDIGSSIFVEEDGKMFLHFLFCENEEAEQAFFQLQSLQAWRAALVESDPEVSLSELTRLSVVGSTAKLL
jgi:porphobilinogen deaminase